jgi:hypothetical protein
VYSKRRVFVRPGSLPEEELPPPIFVLPSLAPTTWAGGQLATNGSLRHA